MRTTGTPAGTVVWVVNFAGIAITISNTTVGNVNIADGKAAQFLYLNGSEWIPVQ